MFFAPTTFFIRALLRSVVRIQKGMLFPTLLSIYLISSVQAEDKTFLTDGTRATVSEIIDGDTIRLRFSDETESVRLIGIDSLESRENQRAYRQAIDYKVSLKTILSLGKEATLHLKSLAPRGTTLIVISDRVKRDKYGRRLSYVYTTEGVMLNEKMVEDGFASPLAIKPNTRFQDRFNELAENSAEQKKGIWRYLRFSNYSPR